MHGVKNLTPKQKMKSPTRNDWTILAVAFVLGAILGAAVFGLFHNCPQPPAPDTTLIDSLRHENTALITKVAMRDSSIVESEKRQALHDSVIINNHRALKKDYEKIKNFTPDTRAAYIDSILKRANIRK